MLPRLLSHTRHFLRATRPAGYSHLLARRMTSTTSTFHLPDTKPPIPVTHPKSLSQDRVLNFPAFKTWLNTLRHSLFLQRTSSNHPFHNTPYSLKSIDIQSVDFFGGQRIGFLKLKAVVSNDEGEHFPGSIFMRGGSVAMLIILTLSDAKSPAKQDQSEEYAILTVQPRIPAGSLSFIELPAGMIDDCGTFAGAAAKEIQEETGLEISSDELVDLTQLAGQVGPPASKDNAGWDEERLQDAIYPSPGGSDEFIPIFLARKSLTIKEIDELKGKLTGLRDHGEKISLKVVKLAEVWNVAFRDGKTLAAMALYDGLKKEGMV